MNEEIVPAQKSEPAFKIVIAGNGRLLERICKIIFSRPFASSMLGVGVVALLLDEEERSSPISLPELSNLPIYPTAEELFAKEPNIRLVLDVSNNGKYNLSLRKVAPSGVNLLTPSAVLFICMAIEKEALTLDGGERLNKLRNSFLVMINQMDEDIVLVNSDKQVVEVNEHFLLLNGGVAADYVGKSYLKVFSEECIDVEGKNICELVLDIKERFTRVFTKPTPEGKIKYLRLLVFPLPTDYDQNKVFVFMRQDITNIIQMEQRLKQSEKLATVSELSTYIMHEIRNPIFAISGFANSLLRSTSLDDNATEKAKVILQESQRLDTILKSFISFSKPMDDDITDVDLEVVINQVTKVMEFDAPSCKITLVKTVNDNLPRVRGNADLLKQAILNIFKNSIEAMPNGGTITINACTKGHMIDLTISDTGSGMEEKELTKIFSPFYSTKGKGAGLGLSMAKKIIEDVGGKLTLESKKGIGTAVYITLLPALAVSISEIDMVSYAKSGVSLKVKIPPGA